MQDNEQARNNAADRFYLTVKEERLEQTKFIAGQSSSETPDHLREQFRQEWRSAQHKMLGQANDYLAHNVHDLGRPFDTFREPKLVESAKQVESILQAKIGAAPEHFAKRLEALQLVSTESQRGDLPTQRAEFNRFAMLAKYLNQPGQSAVAPSEDAPKVERFNPVSARDLVRSISRFQVELVTQIKAAPAVNTAHWLDDFDAKPDPKFKADYADFDDDDDGDALDNAKPLFNKGRPSDNLERFPQGITIEALQSEVDRVRQHAQARTPIVENLRINSVFRMSGAESNAPTMDMSSLHPDNVAPLKRQRSDSVGSDEYYLDLPMPVSPSGHDPSTSQIEPRERARDGRGL